MYVKTSVESAWSNVPNIFTSQVKTTEETSGITKSNTNIIAEQTRTHRTTTSDTLWRLAVRYYNNGYRWTKIYEANRKLIPDPNKLDKDITLVIPE